MDAVSEIELRRVGWSPELEHVLSMVDLQSPHTTLQFYRDAIGSQNLIAIGVHARGELIGAAVIDFDDGDVGSECVIVLGGGKLAGVDLTATILPAMEGIAKGGGASSIRFVTHRRGLVSKALSMGYQASQVILRKDL